MKSDSCRLTKADRPSFQSSDELLNSQLFRWAGELSFQTILSTRQQQTSPVIQPFPQEFCQQDLVPFCIGRIFELGKYGKMRFFHSDRSMRFRAVFQNKDISQPRAGRWLEGAFAVGGPQVSGIAQRLFRAVIEVVAE